LELVEKGAQHLLETARGQLSAACPSRKSEIKKGLGRRMCSGVTTKKIRLSGTTQQQTLMEGKIEGRWKKKKKSCPKDAALT